MLYKKTGFPEENELVVCTVGKVHYNSVFVNLDHYSKQGVIHISEVSPGRIRNIRDYVKEGKVIVCKVLRVNKERGHIDLSLRRVGEGQRRSLIDEMKQEQKAEKIVEYVAGNLKRDFKELYHELYDEISKEHDMLHHAFMAVVDEGLSLEKFGIDTKVAKILGDEIRSRIKPSEVRIGGTLRLQSYEPNGVEIIRDAVKEGLKGTENVTVFYAGAGKYQMSVVAPDYPEAEQTLKDVSGKAIAYAESHNSTGSFAREEK
jgi:translation initiation factor 2 subunit 1